MSAEYRMKAFIAAEFKKMVQNTPIRKITVSDILKQCGISRGTFYYHFRDKQDLVNWIYRTDIIAPVRAALIDSLSNGGSKNTETPNAMVFHLLYQQKDFFCQAIKLTGQNSLSETIQDEARENIRLIKEQHLQEERSAGPENNDFVSFLNEHVAAFNAITVVQWLKDGMPRPPDVMAEYTFLVNQYGIRAPHNFSNAKNKV